MKKIIAGITLFLILTGALAHNADWLDSSRILENSQINIAGFGIDTSGITYF